MIFIHSLTLSGGYPNILERTTENKRDNWCQSYLQTLLQRDIRDIAHIERLTEIPNLLRVISARVRGLLNISELSRTSNLPQSTLKRYLALLEMLYLVIIYRPGQITYPNATLNLQRFTSMTSVCFSIF